MTTNATSDHRAAVARLATFYARLGPQDLGRLGEYYAPAARFKDPFNEVQGLPAIRQIFGHMFTALHEPRFVVTQQLVDGSQAFLVWEFRFRFRRFDTVTEQVIRGGSHLTLAADGKVTDHRDYWDAAEELYEKLPGLGAVMRWLRRRANQ
ncbi:nuclear transport factor 2 family protein [Hydrogenophaga sp. RWCD_12]|uniref:nuclear transport factor 2 family protein n=1 Tax=Hydrogenophaga sp. RWCD_12 TaxID=3391190 RepID=UPI003984E857